MLILLREDLNGVGKAGEVVKVKDGYGRNFLIPQKIAYPATDAFINVYNEEIKSDKFLEERMRRSALSVKDKIEGKVLTIKMKVGEEGKLFGSVTSQNIVDLANEIGIDIEKKKIVLDENIKILGEHKVTYKIHTDVSIEITVNVVDEAISEEKAVNPDFDMPEDKDLPSTEEADED